MSSSVLVVGPGALGALFAARLAQAGHQVTIAARTPATQQAIRRHGVRVEGFGSAEAHVNVATGPQEDARFDVVVIATKCQAAVQVARTWADHGELVVCLQNGVMGDALAKVLGPKLVECTVGFPATLIAPGHAVQTGPGRLHIGRWPHGTEGLENLAKLLQTVAPTSVEDNMEGVKWTKLLINSAATSLGALTGLGMGDLLKAPGAGPAFLGIVEEGYQAGRSQGIRFEAVSGLRPPVFLGLKRLGLGGFLLKVLARKYRAMRASSLQGLDRGQATEVDFLNQTIVHAGQESPINRKVVKLLHQIEKGTQQSDPAHLLALA